MSLARHARDANDTEGILRHEVGRSLVAAHPIRTGDDPDGHRCRPARYAARTRSMRRLDRPHRRGRAAIRQAVAAARHRAQRRAHAVGLEHAHGLYARSDRDRPAQPDGQRQRQALRCDRGEHGNFPVPRSEYAYGEPGEPSGARSEDADLEGGADGALAILGARADLGQPDQHAQPDDGREGPRVVTCARSCAGQSGLLQGRLRPSVGQGLPGDDLQPPSVALRSGERQVHADQHLLPDPSPDLRRGRQPNAVGLERRPAARASSAG